MASTGLLISSLPPSVTRIADAWPALPPHIREAILTLADVPRPTGSCLTDWDSGILEDIAWRLSEKCRNVVQACLREEEWHDADGEFFEIIVSGLRNIEQNRSRDRI